MVFQGKLESRRKLHRAQRTKAVVREPLRIDGAQHAPLKIPTAIERVFITAGERIPRDGVDREVAPPRGFGDAHRRIAVDLEALMTAASLRVSARKRDVDLTSDPAGRHDLVDGKTLTDRFNTSDGCEQRGQLLLVDFKYLDVDVLRRAPTQPISHPSADDQRAAAGRGGGLCDAARRVE